MEIWETTEERMNRLHREFFEKTFVLMVREPPCNEFFKNIDIREMISLCINFKLVADFLKCRVPRIADLHDEFNFNEIYGQVNDSTLVRDAMKCFKPKKIILKSLLGANLPVDILRAFTESSPRSLAIELKGFGQQFLIKPTKIEEIYIESSPYDDSAMVINAILRSSTKIEKIKMIHGSIDDSTSVLLGCISLESFKLKNVKIQCQNIKLLATNITAQVFMKKLCLRLSNAVDNNFLPLLLKNIGSMHLTTLELSLGKGFLDMEAVKEMQSLKHVRFNMEDHSSYQLLQEVRKLIISRSNIDFEILIYCSCGVMIRATTQEYFRMFENVTLL